MEDSKAMAEQKSILMVTGNLFIGNNCFPFLAEVSRFYPW